VSYGTFNNFIKVNDNLRKVSKAIMGSYFRRILTGNVHLS
jgi:hypothetical protein